MSSFKQVVTDKFVINFQEGLEDFVNKSLIVVEEQMPILRNLFFAEFDKIQKLKASFFTQREDFVEYIKSVSNGKTPPEWATGCFYNGEIQTLLNTNNKVDIKHKTHTLMHEMTHLYIKKFIYEKYNIQRIRWFDESCACYIDGRLNVMAKEQLNAICEQLSIIQKFDLNILDDINKLNTQQFDAYNMFLIVGKYIFENNLANSYLDLLKTNPEKIRNIGSTILESAIEYAKTKI